MSKADKEMAAEYDFSGKKGVRGKYRAAFREGYSVRVYDGEKIVREEFFASIEPDVREYFPDSETINKALRSLIKLLPNKI